MATFARMADLLELSLRRDIKLETPDTQKEAPRVAQAGKEQVRAEPFTKSQQARTRHPPPRVRGRTAPSVASGQGTAIVGPPIEGGEA